MSNNTENFLHSFEDYGDLGFHGVLLPKFSIEKEHYEKLGLSEYASNAEFLNKLCEKGLRDKGLADIQEYQDRLKQELQTIHELGFTDYILLVWNVISYAQNNDIPTGIGRGSASSSLILYSIDVTGVDPIKYNLFFERFVSKARAKSKTVDGVTYLDGSLLPDVDTDFCYYKRPQIIQYIKDKFPNKTSKILTINTLSTKLVIKEVAKCAAEYSEDYVKRIADQIHALHGKLPSLEEARNDSKDIQRWVGLPNANSKKVSNQRIWDIATKLENLPKNFGVHPSAMAISHHDLEESCPVQLAKSDNNEAELVSGYDMHGVEKIAVKFDALGLRTVSIIDEVCKRTGVDINSVDLSRPEIYEPLQDLKTPHGIFQIEANTQYSACQNVKPDSLSEVSDLMALARPGALAYIGDYAKTKNNELKTESVLETWDNIVAPTKGFILYQEQQMQLAHKVFGFSLEEAETIRKIVGKKRVKEMPAWEEKIYLKAEEKGLSKEIADKFWKSLNESANYSFNKCLSPDTVVQTKNGYKCLYEIEEGEEVLAYNVDKKIDHYVFVKNVHANEVELFEVEMDNGSKISCSMDHKFLCSDEKMHTLREILNNDLKIICNQQNE